MKQSHIVRNLAAILLFLGTPVSAQTTNQESETTFIGIRTSTDYGHTGPKAVCTFPATNPLEQTILTEGITLAEDGGEAIEDGTLYQVHFTGTTDPTNELWHYDTNTWKRTDDGNLFVDVSMVAVVTTTHYASGTTYGIFRSNDNLWKKFELGVADYPNRRHSTIGPIDHDYVALGITSDGHLFGIDAKADLYEIDRKTATERLVGNTGFENMRIDPNRPFNIHPTGGEIDQRTNTFYLAASPDTEAWVEARPAYYTVDLATAKLEKVCDLEYCLYGIFMYRPASSSDAPGEATQLSATFESNNTEGQFSFNIPTATVAGESMNSPVDYTVYASTQVIAQGKAAPGETIRLTIKAIESCPAFVVKCANQAGEGRAARLLYWGRDDTAINSIAQPISRAISIHSLDGRRISSSATLRPGIYISGGKKFVVTH